MTSIHAISEDLRPAPNESLQKNPNTLAVLKPLSRDLPPIQETRRRTEAETTRVEVKAQPESSGGASHTAGVAADEESVRASVTTLEAPVHIQARAKIRRRILNSMEKDHFLYLKQAYQFSAAISPSRLNLVEKKGKQKTSKLFVPKLLANGLGVQSKLAGDVTPKHFLITPMRANNIPGPGRGITKFVRVARFMLLHGNKFIGNQEKVETYPARLENRRWKFYEETLVLRYNPELENLKLYVEFNFEHQLSSNDKLGLGLNDRKATCQVTEGTVAWCVIPVSICGQITEETIVPVKLMTGPLNQPRKLDDLRNERANQSGIRRKIQESCGVTLAAQTTCYPSKQSLFTIKIGPMKFSSDDFRYLPANYISSVKLATVITLHQMILRDCLKDMPSFLDQILDPVLAVFPHILDDQAMRTSFLSIWDVESGKIEQTREKLYACFRECVMRFWPLVNTNDLKETFSNDFATRTLRNERIKQFVAKKSESTLTVGAHAWSNKPFQIGEMRYSIGDFM